jgi:hypothetical protein
MTAQGGRRRNAPKSGARPTVTIEPTFVCTGETDESTVKTRRIPSWRRRLPPLDLRSAGA